MYISECKENWYEGCFHDDWGLLNELDICSGDINEEYPTLETVENVKVCVYSHKKPFTLEEAEQAIIDKYFGAMSIQSQDYGWSEYTIEGFNVYHMTIGGHDLYQILNNIEGYKIFTLEKVETKQ